MMEGAKQCEQSGESSQALTAGRTEKGLFLDDRLHFLGVCCGRIHTAIGDGGGGRPLCGCDHRRSGL